MQQRHARKKQYRDDVPENQPPEPRDIDQRHDGKKRVAGRGEPGTDVDRPQPPRDFVGGALGAVAEIEKQRISAAPLIFPTLRTGGVANPQPFQRSISDGAWPGRSRSAGA